MGALWNKIVAAASEPPKDKAPLADNWEELLGKVVTTPKTAAEYLDKYKAAKIRPEKKAILIAKAKKMASYKEQEYAPVSRAVWGTSDLWWIVSCIHNQEAGSDIGVFKAVLHNGERLVGTDRKTTIVPVGKGPFHTFQEAAIDALQGLKHMARDLGSILMQQEKYNGLGYRGHGVASPYLWSMTDQYEKGHYSGDHNWRPDEISQNYGIAAVIKTLEELGLISFDAPVSEPVKDVPVTDYKARLLKLAASKGCEALGARMLSFMAGHEPRYVSIFDVSKTASEKRLHVLDLSDNSVRSVCCSVGSGSDTNNDGKAEKFSNTSGSNCTALGVIRYAETYTGKHGLSLKIDGLESTNSNCRSRAIVMHTADYVTDSRAGRSNGCEAISASNKDLIPKLANGSFGIIGKS